MKGVKHGIISCELNKMRASLAEIDGNDEWEIVTVLLRGGGFLTEEALIIVRFHRLNES